jgi:transposase, IS5 family
VASSKATLRGLTHVRSKTSPKDRRSCLPNRGHPHTRRFAGIELGDDRIPDETTILNFQHLLQRHGLTEAIFAEVNGHLSDKGTTLCSGTLVDATIIDAPSSTKNKAGTRDPEMSSTKKGNDWYFGMKAHVGVDVDSRTVHSLEATTAKVHDSRVRDDLLHGDETSVWADVGLCQRRARGRLRRAGQGLGRHAQGPEGRPAASRSTSGINRIIAMVRAKVEHPFRVIKRQFGHVKTRYRGLAKNRAQLFTLFALGNLFLVRRRLMT